MSDIIDLGGAPGHEDCAQLGHTPDFERLNRLEVAAYRAAVIARFGPPPDGCALVFITNRHDFGIYRTLGLKVDAGAYRRDPSVAAYVERSEEHTSELQSLMSTSYAVFCLIKKKKKHNNKHTNQYNI